MPLFVYVCTHACIHMICVYMYVGFVSWRRINVYWSLTTAWMNDNFGSSAGLTDWRSLVSFIYDRPLSSLSPSFIPLSFFLSLSLSFSVSLSLSLPVCYYPPSPSTHPVSSLRSCSMIRPGDHNTNSLRLTFLFYSSIFYSWRMDPLVHSTPGTGLRKVKAC